MAPTFTAISTPSRVPLVIASIEDSYIRGTSPSEKSVISFEGIIILAYIIAAGIDKTDAVIKCWIRLMSPNWI